jgi:cytochrome P450
MDPPDHTRYRRLLNRAFTPRAVSELEQDLRRHVRDLVLALREAGRADFVEALAKPVPAWLVAHYLGVPDADRSRFAAWTDAIVQAATGVYGGVGEAVGELYEYFGGLIDRRRREPGADLVSELLRADEEGRGIGLEGVLGYAFVLIAGGNDTTVGLLAGTAELLTARPDQRRRLLEDPTLLPVAVEEFLRLTSPVQGLCRVTRRDVALHDRLVPAGDRVLLCYGAANRDEREFGPDAEELDVGRDPRRILTFSSGAHHCLGAATARLMGRVVLEELLGHMPGFAVDAPSGTFAGGAFTRRYESLPFDATGLSEAAA